MRRLTTLLFLFAVLMFALPACSATQHNPSYIAIEEVEINRTDTARDEAVGVVQHTANMAKNQVTTAAQSEDQYVYTATTTGLTDEISGDIQHKKDVAASDEMKVTTEHVIIEQTTAAQSGFFDDAAMLMGLGDARTTTSASYTWTTTATTSPTWTTTATMTDFKIDGHDGAGQYFG